MENSTVSVLRVAYTFTLKKQFFFIHLYMDSKYPRVRRLFDNANVLRLSSADCEMQQNTRCVAHLSLIYSLLCIVY